MTNNELAAKLIIEAVELIDEGAVKTNNSITRKRKKYLDRHNYDPKEETIETKSGRKVHFDNKNRSETCYDHEKQSFSIADDKFRRNNRGVDSASSHETGHGLLHGDPDERDVDKDKFTVDPIKTIVKNMSKGDREKFKEIIHNPSNHDLLMSHINADKNAKDKKAQEARRKNYEIFNKYADYKNGKEHRQPMEYESDAFSVAENGLKNASKNLQRSYKDKNVRYSKKAIKNVNSGQVRQKMHEKNDYDYNHRNINMDQYFKNKKDIDSKSSKQIIADKRKEMHDFNREQEITLQRRLKAMKDKNVNHEIYRKKSQNECIAELLIEAAELLKD